MQLWPLLYPYGLCFAHTVPIWAAQPRAKHVCVQALIACRRYPDAAIAADRLHGGQDKLYLQAEGLWRQSHVDAAAQLLSDACLHFPHSMNCLELRRWVESLQQDMHVAHTAFEDGAYLLHRCVQLSQFDDSPCISKSWCFLCFLLYVHGKLVHLQSWLAVICGACSRSISWRLRK